MTGSNNGRPQGTGDKGTSVPPPSHANTPPPSSNDERRRHQLRRQASITVLVSVTAYLAYSTSARATLRTLVSILVVPPLFIAVVLTLGLAFSIVTLLVAAARVERKSPRPPFATLQRAAVRPLAFTTRSRWKEILAAMEREAGGAGGAGTLLTSSASPGLVTTNEHGVTAALAEAASSGISLPLAAASRAPVPGLDTPAVAAHLDSILGLIRATFVLPWYSKISPSGAFPDAVEGIIRHALGATTRRAEDVDWPDLLTARILPLVTEHLQHFRSIEHLSAAPASPEKGLPLPLPAHAHPALTPRNVAPDADLPAIEAHLRGHVQRALAVLLPEKERTEVVAIMVREIVLGAVVMPLFNMLCDSDFWNRQISEQGAKLLHERKQVNKVLSALSTLPPAVPSPNTKKKEFTTTSITAHSTTKEFEEFMRSIPKLRTLGEARRLRADVDRELRSARAAQRVASKEEDKTGRRAVRYVHRLERARWQIDRRIMSLSGRMETETRTSDSPLPNRAAKVTLNTILADPSCLAYWLEYMERRGRSHLVQYWLTVEGFKDPLDATGGLGLKTEDRGMNARTMKDDLAFLHATYFSSGHKIAASPRLVEAMAQLAEKEGPLSAEDVEHGKRVIYETQRAVYSQMEEEDWADFQKSELFLKVLADLKASAAPRHVRSISHSPPASPTQHLGLPVVTKQRSASDQLQPRSPRPYLVNGSFAPVTPATPSTKTSTKAPDFTQRRVTPDRSASTSPRSGGGVPPRTSTPPLRRSVYLDTLMGGDEASERDPLFSDDKSDNEIEHLEAQRMEAIQAALNEIIAEDAGSRKVSESLEPIDEPESPESPGFDTLTDVDPLSLSTPGLIEVTTPRRDAPYQHPLGGRKITSRSAEDLKAAARNSPVRTVNLAAAPAHPRLVRRGSTDGNIHRRSKSIFADDVEADDDGADGESAFDALVSSTVDGAMPGNLHLAGQITRMEGKLAELKAQDALLDGLIRQAELTGNAKELKLLLRSQSSLRREMRTAELEVAQYRRQEEENRLVPGRTRATIPHSAVSVDGQVVRYTVEIAQVASDGGEERVVLTWRVVHRYSEFWELDRALHEAAVQDPVLAEAMRHVVDLPGKRLVALTSGAFVEARRAGLERYVQSVLSQGALCDAPLVRDFLSQRLSDAPGTPTTLSRPLAPRIVQTLYRTVASGLEEANMPPMLDLMTQGLSRQLAEVAGGVAGVTDELAGLMPVLRPPWVREPAPAPAAPTVAVTTTATVTATAMATPSSSAGAGAGPGRDTDAAARLEEHLPTPTGGALPPLPPTLQPLGGEGAQGSFTTPICDLFIEVFDLKENNWLRRQAIVIILQQVLGGTIERKLRDSLRTATTPHRIARLLSSFQDALWPQGQRRPDAPPRTDAERLDARITSSRRLGMLIPDVAANMIGRGNARRAAHLVWGALQDGRLNRHLVLCIFDEIFGAMFPK